MTKEQALYLLAGMHLGFAAPSRAELERVSIQLQERYDLMLREINTLMEEVGKEIALPN